MKIKKVEIQAFKSYLNRKDGTFDFTIKTIDSDSQIAEFVSIYAPNGFGKTSFYDAVDYAVTHNISRYIRSSQVKNQNKDLGKKLVQDTANQYILRNRDADAYDKNLKTEVLVDTSVQLFKSNYRKPKKNSIDYAFELKNTRNKYFKTVLLSQESIDGFLRETKPDERYEKFVDENSELKAIDHNRKQLSRMCRDIEKSIDRLISEKNVKAAEIEAIDATEDPFEFANQLIEKLNNDGVNIAYFESPYTGVEKHKTSDQVSIANSYQEHKITVINSELALLQDFDANLKNSQLQLSVLKTTQEQLNILNGVITNIDKVNSLNVQNKFFSNSIDELNKKLVTLFDYKSEVDNYFVCYKEKSISEDKLSVKQLKSVDLKIKIDNKINDITLLERRIHTFKEDLSNSIRKQKEAPVNFNTMSSLKDEVIILGEKKKSLTHEKLVFLQSEVEQKKCLDYLTNLNISQAIDDKEFRLETKLLMQFHPVYIVKRDELDFIKKSINKNESKLTNIKKQSKDISDLISKASEIIGLTSQVDCPLCQQPYSDFEELKRKISTNPLLSEAEQKLANKIQEIKIKETICKTELQDLQRNYDSSLSSLVEEHNSRIKLTRHKLIHLEIQLEQVNNLCTLKKAKALEFSEVLQHKVESQFNIDIQKNIAALSKDIAKGNDEIVPLKQDVEKLTSSHRDLEFSILESNSELNLINDKLKRFSIYSYCTDILKSRFTEKDDIVSNLSSSIEQVDIDKLRVSESVNSNKNSINKIETEIPTGFITFKDSQLNIQKCEYVTKIDLYKNSLQDFFSGLTLLSCIPPNTEDEWIALHNLVNEHVEDKLRGLQLQKSIYSELEVVSALSEKAVNYCNRIDLLKNIESIDVSIQHNNVIHGDLYTDLEKINAHIQKTTNEYFKTDLINEIYSAIDPHPEYKEIEFKCYVHGDGKAQLAINAVSKNNNDKVSPSLNFSSAQVNILSLSIFLARALTTTDEAGKPVDCIFIDDPIQSIDSINVLSLIDLFRNIISRFDKQLIISTHDENFHELLKKKIPSNIFKSKFLRLASFGQVTYD